MYGRCPGHGDLVVKGGRKKDLVNFFVFSGREVPCSDFFSEDHGGLHGWMAERSKALV